MPSATSKVREQACAPAAGGGALAFPPAATLGSALRATVRLGGESLAFAPAANAKRQFEGDCSHSLGDPCGSCTSLRGSELPGASPGCDIAKVGGVKLDHTRFIPRGLPWTPEGRAQWSGPPYRIPR